MASLVAGNKKENLLFVFVIYYLTPYLVPSRVSQCYSLCRVEFTSASSLLFGCLEYILISSNIKHQTPNTAAKNDIYLILWVIRQGSNNNKKKK